MHDPSLSFLYLAFYTSNRKLIKTSPSKNPGNSDELEDPCVNVEVLLSRPAAVSPLCLEMLDRSP